jgi:deoxycytidylate deaminase
VGSRRKGTQCSLKGVNLYVVRRDSKGIRYKESAPCESCTRRMKLLNVKYVIYSNSEGELVKQRVRDYTTQHQSCGIKYLKRTNIIDQ